MSSPQEDKQIIWMVKNAHIYYCLTSEPWTLWGCSGLENYLGPYKDDLSVFLFCLNGTTLTPDFIRSFKLHFFDEMCLFFRIISRIC